MKRLTFILCIFVSLAAFTKEKVLFTIEKSHNPENILVVSTSLEDSCFLKINQPLVMDFYWLMNRQARKAPHPMILKEIKDRVEFLPIKDSKLFQIEMNDLKEVNHDLPETRVNVEVSKDPEGCALIPLITLGQNDGSRTMVIQTIYSEVKKTLGIPSGIKFIELRGKDRLTNEKLVARYMAR